MAVSLREVAEALEMTGDEVTCWLNPQTGEIQSIGPDDRHLAEHEGDPEDLPAWQRERLPIVREILDTDTWKMLPDRHDIHEWSIMERFSRGRTEDDVREELLDALHGRGAFRAFKRTIHRLGIEKEWYGHRQGAFEDIAREWLEEQDIEYEK